MLSAEDQERFSRHLLLDPLLGKGQERICAGTVRIALPGPFAIAAESCARALAAAGVGRLELDDLGEGWAESSARECRRIAPGVEIVSIGHEANGVIELRARAIFVCIGHQGPRSPREITLAARAPGSAADGAALGALAALEAIKLLAEIGSPAPLPLSAFPGAAT